MNAVEIIKVLQNHGFEAYIVGGAVRDMILGIPPKDEDVVTSANPDQIIYLFDLLLFFEVDMKSIIISIINFIMFENYY